MTQCQAGELSKPWAEQQHELLCVNSGRFTHAQVNWTVSCWELFPIRKASEKERHLLIGDHPWASINDHKALTYLLDEGSRQGTVTVAARDRLRRWAAYLLTHNFVTIHIPGVSNCFTDLLSRQGCKCVVQRWRPNVVEQQDAQQCNMDKARAVTHHKHDPMTRHAV